MRNILNGKKVGYYKYSNKTQLELAHQFKKCNKQINYSFPSKMKFWFAICVFFCSEKSY